MTFTTVLETLETLGIPLILAIKAALCWLRMILQSQI